MAGILCDTGDKMCLTGLFVPGFGNSSNGAQRERFPGSPTRRYPRQVLTAVATGMLLTEGGNACLTRRTSGFTLRLCADDRDQTRESLIFGILPRNIIVRVEEYD